MKRFTNVSLAMLLIISSMTSYAQQDASKLLEKVIAHMTSFNNIRFDFTYRMTNQRAGIDESQAGILYLNKEAYRVEMNDQQIICDGKTVWTYLKDSKEVMVADASEDPDAISPTTLLTGYHKEYLTNFATDPAYERQGLKIIELRPSHNKNFSLVKVVIKESESMVTALIIDDNGGNSFEYDLSKMKTNNDLASDFFRFDAKRYPDVDVIDMR